MFALAFALKNNIRPKPFTDSGSFFHSKNLDKEEDIPLINAAAYYATKNLDVLVNDQEKSVLQKIMQMEVFRSYMMNR